MFKLLGYFIELLRGSFITTRHFIVNIFFHTLALFGMKTKRKGAVTIQYPEARKEISPRHRSLHRLMKRDDGKPRCVVCMLCATVCPSECIFIEATEDPDPEIQKLPSKFIIDLSRCCFCGFCVEACPEDAIRMDTTEVELANYSRKNLVLDLDKLLNLDYSRVEIAVAARRGGCSCGSPPQTRHNEADAVRSARPKGKKRR